MPSTTRLSKTHPATSKSSNTKQASPAKSQAKASSSTPSKFETKNITGKRKRAGDDAASSSQSSPNDKKKSKLQQQQEEKRLKPYRGHAPQSFLQKLQRAQTQRMIVVGRTRHGTGPDLREEIDIVGSTGNIYKVTVARVPGCTCPDHLKGNECKHKVYALHTVLKAPEHLQYQRALLGTELESIFATAPPIPTDIGDSEDKDGKRKPIEGECPICYMDFEEDKNELVWCKAACGNNMHKSCFEQWAASQRGQAVRCVYCRTEWEMDKEDLQKIQKAGVVGEDGYINVAEQFGLSRARDYSGYYQPWARRQFGLGW